jgi:hypothetical protein
MILNCGAVRVFDHECCCSGDDNVDDDVIRNRLAMYDWIKETYIGSSWRSNNDESNHLGYLKSLMWQVDYECIKYERDKEVKKTMISEGMK